MTAQPASAREFLIQEAAPSLLSNESLERLAVHCDLLFVRDDKKIELQSSRSKGWVLTAFEVVTHYGEGALNTVLKDGSYHFPYPTQNSGYPSSHPFGRNANPFDRCVIWFDLSLNDLMEHCHVGHTTASSLIGPRGPVGYIDKIVHAATCLGINPYTIGLHGRHGQNISNMELLESLTKKGFNKKTVLCACQAVHTAAQQYRLRSQMYELRTHDCYVFVTHPEMKRKTALFLCIDNPLEDHKRLYVTVLHPKLWSPRLANFVRSEYPVASNRNEVHGAVIDEEDIRQYDDDDDDDDDGKEQGLAAGIQWDIQADFPVPVNAQNSSPEHRLEFSRFIRSVYDSNRISADSAMRLFGVDVFSVPEKEEDDQ